ncbi:hypothetical protein C4D60_Mb10t25240 [Musa balbisiana]|uniref:Uncharacterized protein n=1 Tax=Musa balbisiana TaxID=52838 RepID=A0A4S8IZR0_MUSBA|nr:hypothetical protein C4D60_Mb10t25240 [Musa balbisiana]
MAACLLPSSCRQAAYSGGMQGQCLRVLDSRAEAPRGSSTCGLFSRGVRRRRAATLAVAAPMGKTPP